MEVRVRLGFLLCKQNMKASSAENGMVVASMESGKIHSLN